MIIPVDYAQVNYKLGGAALPELAETTLGLNVELYAGSASDAAEDAALAFVDNILPRLGNAVTFLEASVKFGPNSTGPSGVKAGGATGGVGAGAMAPQVSWLITKVTGFGGRQGRGRMYIPGLIDSIVADGGIIDGTQVTLMQTAMDNFHGDLVAFGLIPTLLRAPDSPIGAPVPVTSFEVQNRVATQRRRNRR